MSTLSETLICNKGLGWIGAKKITSLDVQEDSVEWDLCDQNYETLRDAVLEEREWTFAVQRQGITAVFGADADQAFGNETRFLKPADTIRILNVYEPGSLENAGPIARGVHDKSQIPDWEIEGKWIICVADKIDVRYIRRVKDVGLYSPNFVEALAQRMAAEFAPTLTESKTLTESMWAGYEFKLGKSAVYDGMQGRTRRVSSQALVRRR